MSFLVEVIIPRDHVEEDDLFIAAGRKSDHRQSDKKRWHHQFACASIEECRELQERIFKQGFRSTWREA